MREWNNSRGVTLLALGTVLWLTVGLHLIHPLVHDHACHHGELEVRASRCAPETQPPASRALAAATDTDDDDCPICAFLFTFHGHNPAPPPAAISSDVVAVAAPPLAFLPAPQFCSSPFGARAPPF